MLELNSRFPVLIQYIPGHKNIEGNELADLAAKAGHRLEEVTEAPICREDRLRLFMSKQKDSWYHNWLREMTVTGKGHHLFGIKDHIGHWSW